MLALWLEHKFTKDQILEIYLNRVYLGAGTYGVDAAAQRYFDKSAQDLTLYEAAVIAGLLKAPTRFSPAHDRGARRRARRPGARQHGRCRLHHRRPRRAAPRNRRPQLAQAAKARPGSRYFADWMAEQVPGFADVNGRDVVVTTTLDPRMQTRGRAGGGRHARADGEKDDGRAGRAGRDVDRRRGPRHGRRPRLRRQPVQPRDPGAAPAGIELQALRLSRGAGARLAAERHVQRRAGAASAIGSRTITKTTIAATSPSPTRWPIRSTRWRRRCWRAPASTTSSPRRTGSASPRTCRATPAWRSAPASVTLIELTAAYAAFASGGTGAWPYGIVEIRDAHGGVLYRREGAGAPQVIDPAIAGEMNELLTGVIEHGTGRARGDRPSGRGQDRHDPGFPRRLVHRLHRRSGRPACGSATTTIRR